jgi:squalene monooxygenase
MSHGRRPGSTSPTVVITSDSTRRTEHHEADVVVVGAGVFGCAIAFALANQGRSILLLERWLHEPDRIVGELLQPGGLASLRRLGLSSCVEGIDAALVAGYSVIYHGQESVIPYPGLDEKGQVINLLGGPEGQGQGKKPTGCSFHHGRFIMKLREACASHENITVVETEVKSVIRDDGGTVLGVESLTVSDKSTGTKIKDYYFGKLTIAADGYMSIFRKQFLPAAVPQVRSKFYALELIDCELPSPYHGTVVIGKNSEIILLYQIGTHETRMLIDVPQNCPAAAPAAGGVRGYIRDVVIPILPEQVRPHVLKALEAGPAIPKSMPNSYMPARAQRVEGLLILGDALNMRHPLTGGGMTVAFNDAEIISQELHPSKVPSLSDAAAVARATSNMYRRRKALTGNINVLAQALYSLFAADDWQLRVLQRGCFEYFRQQRTDGPAGLLGGLIQRPEVLAYHFFTVAFVAIGLHLREMNVLLYPLGLIQAVLILWKACVVFLPVMFAELF